MFEARGPEGGSGGKGSSCCKRSMSIESFRIAGVGPSGPETVSQLSQIFRVEFVRIDTRSRASARGLRPRRVRSGEERSPKAVVAT